MLKEELASWILHPWGAPWDSTKPTADICFGFHLCVFLNWWPLSSRNFLQCTCISITLWQYCEKLKSHRKTQRDTLSHPASSAADSHCCQVTLSGYTTTGETHHRVASLKRQFQLRSHVPRWLFLPADSSTQRGSDARNSFVPAYLTSQECGVYYLREGAFLNSVCPNLVLCRCVKQQHGGLLLSNSILLAFWDLKVTFEVCVASPCRGCVTCRATARSAKSPITPWRLLLIDQTSC